MKLLIINPGSTSTKVSVFEDEMNIFTESVFHDAPELCRMVASTLVIPRVSVKGPVDLHNPFLLRICTSSTPYENIDVENIKAMPFQHIEDDSLPEWKLVVRCRKF